MVRGVPAVVPARCLRDWEVSLESNDASEALAQASARALADARKTAVLAIDFAKTGNSFTALANLRRATHLFGADAAVWEARGCAAALVGALDEAEQCLTRAGALDPGGQAPVHLAMLRSGRADEAWAHVAATFSFLRGGNVADARNRLAAAVQILGPNPVTDGLTTVIDASARPAESLAPATARTQGRATQTVRFVLATLVILAIAFAGMIGRRLGQSETLAVTPKAVMTRKDSTSAATPDLRMPRLLLLAYSGRADSLMALLAEGVPADWPTSLRLMVHRDAMKWAPRQLREANLSADAGDFNRSLAVLSSLENELRGTWLEDDWLYAKARAFLGAGLPDSAAGTAKRLVAAYPNSIFNNSHIRLMAAQETEK